MPRQVRSITTPSIVPASSLGIAFLLFLGLLLAALW
jgi:hypothetical protein